MTDLDLKGTLVVKTQSGAVYTFGAVDSPDGARAVSKEGGNPLPFNRCVLLGGGYAHFLWGDFDADAVFEGKQLALLPLNYETPPGKDYWFTTPVTSLSSG